MNATAAETAIAGPAAWGKACLAALLLALPSLAAPPAYADGDSLPGAGAPEPPPACGSRGSLPVSPWETAGRRLSLERDLIDGGLTHCGYFLRRACQDWESGDPGAGLAGFEMAYRFCDDRATAARGRVAARLEREEWSGAYAAWREAADRGGADSLALVPWERPVFGGLSLTDFPPRGPAAYRLGLGLDPGALNPERAYRLSALPGAGFLYTGEPGLAFRHFVLGTGLTALAGWRIWTGFHGSDHDARMAAFLDAGVVVFFLWRRYYLGGMREARRIAQAKNRREGARRVREMASRQSPFPLVQPAPR